MSEKSKKINMKKKRVDSVKIISKSKGQKLVDDMLNGWLEIERLIGSYNPIEILIYIRSSIEVIKFYAQDKYSNTKEYGPEEVLEDEGKKAQQFLGKWGIK